MLKQNLTAQQLAIVDSEFQRKGKSKLVMYLLWIFVGGIGGHRYYLGDIGMGIGMTLTLGGFGLWKLKMIVEKDLGILTLKIIIKQYGHHIHI